MKYLPLLALLLAAPHAHADVNGDLAKIEKNLRACIEEDGSNLHMKICTSDAYDAADKVLNVRYRAALADLTKKTGDESLDYDNAEVKRRLVAAQRAWVPYRDAQCELEGASMMGGSGETLVMIDCSYRMTVERVKAVDEYGVPR